LRLCEKWIFIQAAALAKTQRRKGPAIKIFHGDDHEIMLAPNPSISEYGSDAAKEGPNFAPGRLDTMTGW